MPQTNDDLAPGNKDPVEGARGPDQGAAPAPADAPGGAEPGHLGPAGDPAEGKGS